MWFWPLNSTILIFVFFISLLLVNLKSLSMYEAHDWGSDKIPQLKKIPTSMLGLDYFNTKEGIPVLSLKAQEMENLENDFSFFVRPNGIYLTKEEKIPVYYQAELAEYNAKTEVLKLLRQAKMDYQKSHYQADKITYFLKDGVLLGSGEVIVDAHLEKSAQKVHIESPNMKAWTKIKKSFFNPIVTGYMESYKRPPQPTIHFSSKELTLDSLESHVNLLDDVKIKRADVDLSSRKADIFMENQNKKLKYLILSDDVKMVEKLVTKSGEPIERRAFGERLEGFGYDESFHLSGAPRVEQGKDILKGYKITLREKLEFIEVEDAISDIETKKKEKKDKK